MYREVIDSGCGIVFDPTAPAFAGLGIDPQSEAIKAEGKDGYACLDENDSKDITGHLHDDLVDLPLAPFWWLFEIFPTTYIYRGVDGLWRLYRK